MAPGKKNAQRLKLALVFLDETGLLMAPLVRRTWAPRGRTPVLYQRTAAREKASTITALSLSPRRRRVGLYFSVLPAENVTAAHLLAFLRALARHLPLGFVVVWDRLPGHRARIVTSFLERHPRRGYVLLPPYAPELNPVEYLWAYLKRNPLANHPPRNASHLAATARRHLAGLRARPSLLRSLFLASPLFVRPL